jgi:murein DD-endopeptidase MepM/ murein hydrolase activator NlpD
MLLSLIAAVGLSVMARRRGRARFARLAEIAAVPFLLVVVIGAVAAVPKGGTIVMQHTQPVSAPAAAEAATVGVRSAVTVSHQLPSAGDVLLTRLETYETQVADQQAQIQVLMALASQASPTDRTVSPQRGPFDSALDPAVAAHHVATTLESTLQAEYGFVLNTARDPNQAQALLQAAGTQPMPVREAVAYDVQAVQAQLAQEAAIAQAAKPGANGATPSLGGTAPGTLSVPLNGAITQGFGPSGLAFEPALTFNGVTYPHFHTGIDIASPFDSPVAAAADGVVAIAGAETDSQGHLVGYGNYIVIAHSGGMITLYGHLDQLLVHVGQTVHAGDLVGLEGTTGNSTGPHLHFEVRVGGLLSNPLTYLAGRLSAAR